MDDVMKEKIENDAAALMRSVARAPGPQCGGSGKPVRQSKSFTDQEALSQHLIDYVASSQANLFEQLKGKPFKRFNGQEVTLDLTGQRVVPFGMTLKEQILNYLMDPNIAFILLAIGALALYAEFDGVLAQWCPERWVWSYLGCGLRSQFAAHAIARH